MGRCKAKPTDSRPTTRSRFLMRDLHKTTRYLSLRGLDNPILKASLARQPHFRNTLLTHHNSIPLAIPLTAGSLRGRNTKPEALQRLLFAR